MAEGSSAAPPAAFARRLALAAGAAVAALAAAVLIGGWGFGIGRLTDLVFGLASMKPNTAVCLLLEGAALMLQTSVRGQRLARGFGLTASLIGVLTLLEYVARIDLGIDQVLITDASASRFPGRMAPLSAANIVAMGLALSVVRHRRAWPSHVPALFVGANSFVTLAGYVYGTATLYSFGPYGSIAIHTAAAFTLLTIGVIALRGHDGIAKMLASQGPGGHLARRFLPVSLLLPGLLEWMRLVGQNAGLYDTAFGVAIVAVTLTVILLIITVQSAAWLDGVDLQRQRILRDLDSARRVALEREFNLAAVIEGSEDAIIGSSVTGIIRTWNGGAERLYGYTADEAIGQPVRMLAPQELQHDLQGMITACAAGETIKSLQTIRLTKGGRPVDVSVSVSPIRSANGAIIGLSAIARDMTEQQTMLRTLERQASDLQRSNDELTQFAYIASHDLQEPLRMVASYTELLSSRYEGKLDERADKYIRYISEGATRMQRLIRELLAYARVGTRTKPTAPVDLNDVMSTVRRDLKRLIEGAAADVVVDPLPVVMGDDIQLGQVLQNLVGNAIKFRSERSPRVKVHARREGVMWQVSVEDNGIGIDMKFHDRVFEIFRRLHERDTYDGTGVGLAIVKRIVERHGGRVWFESTIGWGTTFHFTVPAAPSVKQM